MSKGNADLITRNAWYNNIIWTRVIIVGIVILIGVMLFIYTIRWFGK